MIRTMNKGDIASQRAIPYTGRRVLVALCLVFACAFAIALAAPTSPAYAYFLFGTVEVETGASQLSVEAGQSTSVSVSVTPASDDQTLGCGMGKCPQSCTSVDAAGEEEYGCIDVNGNCTCAGTEYTTYYPEVRVSSSNSAIATASVNGSTIVVTGNSAGEAHITVSASLRQWTSNTTTIDVTVTGSGQSSTASVDDVEVDVPEAAVTSGSSEDEDNERVIETIAGHIYAAKITSSLDTAEYFSRIAGTHDQVIFWSGASYENPDYSWTFNGSDVSADSPYLSFDPTITISDVGTGDVANILMQAQDGLALDFSYEGWLPDTASIYVRVDGTYSDGEKLNLFYFNDGTKVFDLVDENLVVGGGYTSFFVDHCSSWALSTDDLTAYEVEETNTPGAINAASIGGGDNGLAIAIGVIAVVVIVVIIVVVVLLVRRRSRRAAAASGQYMTQDDASYSAFEAGGTDGTSGSASPDDAQVPDEHASPGSPQDDAADNVQDGDSDRDNDA